MKRLKRVLKVLPERKCRSGYRSAIKFKSTEIKLEGEECAAAELDAGLSGTVRVSLLEALKDLTSHVVHVNEIDLKYGTHKAELHNWPGSNRRRLRYAERRQSHCNVGSPLNRLIGSNYSIDGDGGPRIGNAQEWLPGGPALAGIMAVSASAAQAITTAHTRSAMWCAVSSRSLASRQ
jgi:hypothetical protein